MRFTARALGVIFAFSLIFFVIKAPFINAQNNAPLPQQNVSSNTNPNVPKNMHNFTQNVMIEVMSAMICQLVGVDPINPKQSCLGIDQSTGKIGFVQNNGGVIGAMGNLITATFQIPIHSTDFFAYTSNNFGLVKSAHAQAVVGQGIGFEGLKMVLPLFLIFRNMAYLLMVIIFVIIGVAIMLRVKIDPRTVMTIQNQIPKLVIGLIMITFSYAIAGLLIDFMWVSIYFVITMIAPAALVNDPTSGLFGWMSLSAPGFANDLFGGQAGGILGLSFAGASSVGSLIHDLIFSDNIQQALVASKPQSCGFIICIPDIGKIIGDAIMGAIGSLFGLIAGIIAFLVFAVAILVALFKLWFALLKCFINVLLAVILGPLWILAGLIPGAGANVGWSGWIKNLAGNLAPFPAVIFLFMVARAIMYSLEVNTKNAGIDPATGFSTVFNPPLVGNLTGNGNTTMFGGLIAIGFILAAPGLVDQVKKAFGTGGGLGLGSSSATGMAVAGAVGGAVGGRLYRRDARSGELEGAVGSRIQRITGGRWNLEKNAYDRNRIQSLIGGAVKAPSLEKLSYGTDSIAYKKAQAAGLTKPEEKPVTTGASTPPETK